MLLPVVVSLLVIVSVLLVVSRSYHLLVWVIIAAGASQAVLLSLTHSVVFQYIDDIPAAILVLAAAVSTLVSGRKAQRKALLLLALLVLLAATGIARSPDIGVGLAQARQVLMPLGLVFAGFVYRDAIPWPRVANYVLFFAAITVLWVLAEELLQQPIIDPTWYYIDVVGGSPSGLRMGLPPSYIADGIGGGGTVFRPGGPFMNPPVMGFLLGLGAYAASTRLRGTLRLVFLASIGSALAFAYARSGIVIFIAVTVVFLIWLKVGKIAGAIVGLAAGAYVVSIFLAQGNTASHSDGLLSGFTSGIRSPLGLGFGTSGYQALLEGGSSGAGSESLLGLYFAWLGWPMIVATLACVLHLWKLLRRSPRRESLPIWLTIAFVLTIASSESASSMASTPILWLIIGSVLATAAPAKTVSSSHARLRPRHEPLESSLAS